MLTPEEDVKVHALRERGWSISAIARVVVGHRLGGDVVEIVTSAGLVVASHQRAVGGAHLVVRSDSQRAALEQAVLEAAAGQGRPCKRKTHRPPGEQARAEAQRLRRRGAGETDDAVVVDLAVYQQHIDAGEHDEQDEGEQDLLAALDTAVNPTPGPAGFDPCGCIGSAATTRRRDGQEQAR